MSKRLSKISRELQIGISEIVKFLNANGIDCEENPAQQIQEDVVDFIRNNIRQSLSSSSDVNASGAQPQNINDEKKNEQDETPLELKIIEEASKHTKLIENIIGYKNEDYIAEKLEKYSIIKDYGFNELKEISYTEYYKLLKSKTPVVIFLERTDSTKSEYAISQLKRASYETSVQIYSLDVYDVYKAETYPESATDSQKQTAEKFMESLSIYDDGLKTPTVLIVKNGKLIASNTTEYAETSEYVEFLTENKLAK